MTQPGNVEGEYVSIVKRLAGQLETPSVPRGEQIEECAPLFTSVQAREQSPRDENAQRLQRMGPA